MEPLAFARATLFRGEPCVLLLVIAHRGSTPGRTGFRMVVAADGELVGSIGGGVMEQKLVELARHQLRTQQLATLLKRQIHRADVAADRSGMICSGEQTVLLFPLNPLRDALSLAEVVQGITSRRPGYYSISAAGFRAYFDQALPDRAALNASASRREPDENIGEPTYDWRFDELFDPRHTVHIVGAGHVGLACCDVLTRLNFRLCLYDNRPELNTLDQNVSADEKIVCPYEELGARITGGPDDYVALMTVGYRTDDVAVRQLLDKPLRFLGMLGSVAKITKLRADLLADGYTDAQLARLRAPIGVSIGSQTPAEIAISIAAQLIQVRFESLSMGR